MCESPKHESQNISSMCLVCGKDNPFSLHAQFVEHAEDGELVCYFEPREIHQSYPDRVHGGISACVLDEVIGRTVQVEHPGVWGVTISLDLKYRRPVPYGERLVARGRCTKLGRRTFEGEGKIMTPDGKVAVEAKGTYAICPPETVCADDSLSDVWIEDNRPLPEGE
ncbi:MAG: PaaI family thioesterase [Coriobacteriaceae bacterium]|nr:PaaI family thioesterase [Coriobacteriaceae bacterium]